MSLHGWIFVKNLWEGIWNGSLLLDGMPKRLRMLLVKIWKRF
jgi:hypothetical protein